VEKLTLGVLLCDSVHPDRLHIDGDYRAIFSHMFRTFSPTGVEVALRFYDVTTGEYPARLDHCDGYLTNGASASPVDDDPWIAPFGDFVRHLHETETKLFAICFGHQMIAHALGGRVEQSERGWGVGVQEVALLRSESWMVPSADRFDIISSHQDQVVELPPGAVLLGSTPHCPISLFRCGSLVGIQGHPEFSPAYARALMDARLESIPAETRAIALQSFALEPDYPLLTSWILSYFEK